MIEIIKGLPRNVVGIAVKGRVTMRDCREVLIPAMEKRLRRHDKIRLYYELGSRFPVAGWDDLDLGIERAARCERVAIVTDIGWVRLTVKALRFLIPGEIRVFATIQVLQARAWIADRTSIETFALGARARAEEAGHDPGRSFRSLSQAVPDFERGGRRLVPRTP